MRYESFVKNCLFGIRAAKDIVILPNKGEFSLLHDGIQTRTKQRINANVNENELSIIEFNDRRFFQVFVYIYKYTKDGMVIIVAKPVIHCYHCKETSQLFCFVEEDTMELCEKAFPGWF